MTAVGRDYPVLFLQGKAQTCMACLLPDIEMGRAVKHSIMKKLSDLLLEKTGAQHQPVYFNFRIFSHDFIRDVQSRVSPLVRIESIPLRKRLRSIIEGTYPLVQIKNALRRPGWAKKEKIWCFQIFLTQYSPCLYKIPIIC